MNSEKILSLNSLKIGYASGGHEKILLPPLTASAKSGELIAVIGKNGIGKSTLLRTLSGLQPSYGGEILFGGKNVRAFSRLELAQKVGYISTENVKVSNLNVYDLVALGRFPYTDWMGNIDPESHNRITDALEMTGMSEFRDRFVSELSDGERQRAMIARIFAQDTGIMIMDEPMAFLDIGSKYDIISLLRLLSQDNAKTIIFSTHDLDMAISQVDKIWLLLENELIEGAPEDLMIAGVFDHLFESPKVQFNSYNGTFSFRKKQKKNIYLEGEGPVRHWTDKAVNRAGFSVSEIKTIPYIIAPSEENINWQFSNQNSIVEFRSIYDLVSFLSKEY
jgi:iron complex transport system ATP-binding protein